MRYEIYQTKRGWHWRLRAKNGEPVAHGVEPFATLGNARRAVRQVRRIAAAEVVIIHGK